MIAAAPARCTAGAGRATLPAMSTAPSADAARARFDAATAAHLTGRLTDDVVLVPAPADDWDRHNRALWADATERARPFDLAALMSDEQRVHGAALDALWPAPLTHRILLRAGDDVIGAYWGTQDTWQRYYMVYSVVGRAWQRRGLYRALLARVIAAAGAAGFREIYSRHAADNNPVIIPKLQAGFVIAGFELTPRFGALVHLRYYLSDALRAAHAYRVDGSCADVVRAHGLIE